MFNTNNDPNLIAQLVCPLTYSPLMILKAQMQTVGTWDHTVMAHAGRPLTGTGY